MREPPPLTRWRGTHLSGFPGRWEVVIQTAASRTTPAVISANAHDPTGAMAVSHTPTPRLGDASSKPNDA